MNNINWIAKAKQHIKEGRHDKAAFLARRVVKSKYSSSSALWVLANTSRSHPEKYAALKLYVDYYPDAPKREEALALIERYEAQTHKFIELQAKLPYWYTGVPDPNPLRSSLRNFANSIADESYFDGKATREYPTNIFGWLWFIIKFVAVILWFILKVTFNILEFIINLLWIIGKILEILEIFSD